MKSSDIEIGAEYVVAETSHWTQRHTWANLRLCTRVRVVAVGVTRATNFSDLSYRTGGRSSRNDGVLIEVMDQETGDTVIKDGNPVRWIASSVSVRQPWDQFITERAQHRQAEDDRREASNADLRQKRATILNLLGNPDLDALPPGTNLDRFGTQTDGLAHAESYLGNIDADTLIALLTMACAANRDD